MSAGLTPGAAAAKKFRTAMQDFAPRGGLLVALSGGADSVCLFDLCVRYAAEQDLPVAAAHLHHGLRGEEADRDAAFCKALCQARGVRLFLEKADVRARAAADGETVEEAARNVRYAFFDRILSEDPAFAFVVTAHHADDLCETMLLNLARGCGLRGLCGIPARRGRILRPLLTVHRAEILGYLAENGLTYVTDSTNADPALSRNRVRLHVLPELEKISPALRENMTKAAALLKKDADFIDGEAKKVYDSLVRDGVMYTKNAHNIHLSLLSRAIVLLYNNHGFYDITEAHIHALCSLITAGKQDFTLSLPGCTAVCTRGALTFVPGVRQHTAEEFAFPIAPGETVTLPSGGRVTLTDVPAPGGVKLRADALVAPLTVRSRKDGDTIRVFGRTHKIKRMIADKKCTAEEKANLFFLCAGDEILYTNLPAIADKAFCRGEKALYIIYKNEGICKK